jgi:poly(hydroxyalkanoate) depolymerase family esterase
MNQRAREQGFFVLYPEQPRSANPSRCWNWFMREHQRRGAGEPALIAGMTREVLQQHDVDPRRVYIAGLSAGGAMAAIVAAAYPEIYAAVGVHSGLPRGAASNMMGALSVMKSGVASPDMFAGAKHFAFAGSARADPQVPVPTIVFHGDQDRTVHPRNSEQLIAAVLDSAAEAEEAHSDGADGPLVEQGVSAQGQRYTRSTHQGRNGSALAEHWLVHGAGHAWSGGQAEGSYTDDKGPDATGEMLRFFFAQPHGPAH